MTIDRPERGSRPYPESGRSVIIEPLTVPRIGTVRPKMAHLTVPIRGTHIHLLPRDGAAQGTDSDTDRQSHGPATDHPETASQASSSNLNRRRRALKIGSRALPDRNTRNDQ